MAVDWTTVKQTETGWLVQDINGEDWFDVRAYLGIEGPGHLVQSLAAENRQLRKVVGALRDILKRDPVFAAVAQAEAAIAAEWTKTQPSDWRG